MTEQLMYVKQATLSLLRHDVESNVERYRSGDFDDLASGADWNLETRFTLRRELLSGLEFGSGSEIEIRNSMLVWRALPDLTPAAAQEPRIWTRLSHVDCLKFSRVRWLNARDDVGVIAKKVRAHYFGDSVTRARDDHPIGRLWWNAYIASQVASADSRLSIEDVLAIFLASADVRLNTIERPGVLARSKLAAAIVHVLRRHSRLLRESDAFREFMKQLNARGGGFLFEAPPFEIARIESFVEGCVMAS